MYKYVLFDWDGTLARTLDVWLDAFDQVLRRRGLTVSRTELAAAFGNFHGMAKEWGVTDIEAAWSEIEQIAERKLPQAKLYPGALHLLDLLRSRQVKVALVTSSPSRHIERQLEAHGLRHYFDAIVTAGDVRQIKPHPEPLKKALRALGGRKHQAIIVGDGDKDLGAASNAGIDSVLFFPAENEPYYDVAKLMELKPTFVVTDLEKLRAIT